MTSMVETFFPTTAGGSTLGKADPIRLHRRVAWQSNDNLPPSGTYYDYVGEGGLIAPAPTRVERLGIRSSPMAQDRLAGKFEVKAETEGLGDLDPRNRCQAMWLMNFLNGYANVATVDTGAYKHRLGYSQANLPSSWLSMISDDDEGIPRRFEQGVCSAFNITAGPKKNVRMTVAHPFGKWDASGAVTESTGTGETVLLVRGFWAPSLTTGQLSADSVDQDVYIKTSTTTSGGITGVQCKVGASGTYGTEILATHGSTGEGQAPGAENWYYVRVGAGDTLCGDEAEALMFHIPSGATYSSVAPDTFKIPKRRDRVATSYATRRSLPEVNAKLYLGVGGSGSATQRFAIHNGWEISGAYPSVSVSYDTGGRQAITVDRRGRRNITLKLDRQHLDATLENYNLRQQALCAVITIYSTSLIASTVYPYGVAFAFPWLTIGDQPAWSVAQGANNLSESYVFTAEEVPGGSTGLTWNGMTFTDDMDAVIWNDYSALAT